MWLPEANLLVQVGEFQPRNVFCSTLIYSSYVLSKTVRLAYVSNHLSLLPVSTELLLRLVSGKEHDRSLLNRLCKSHEILGQGSSLELLSPQTLPSLLIFQPVFFFMLSLFPSLIVFGFLPQPQISNLWVFSSLCLSSPSSPLPSQEQHPREEEQLVLHSLCRFFVLLSHYVNLECLQI